MATASKNQEMQVDKEKIKKPNLRPNVFAALQVDNPDIQHAMDTFQQDCLEYDPRLRDFLVPVRKAHITLLVLHISEEKMEEAKDIFKSVIEEKIINHFDDEDIFEVMFESVGSFNNRVVFAKPSSGVDRMQYMNQELYKAFTLRGFSCDSKFSPHLTLMKKGYKKGNGLKEIPSESFENCSRNKFGIQAFSGIQLLSMTKPQTKEGYYFSEEEYKFRRKTPLEYEKRELEKKKEEVKRNMRENVTNVLKTGMSGNIGMMVAGIVAGAAVIWKVNRRFIK
eukprot:GFUD01041211.1.p1 GENE.GFUD01041211.1~~GFUD01041211.1.p1  ORF type:complete len:280 (+),score=78.63 GFUD01041211.1:257-1096(+)